MKFEYGSTVKETIGRIPKVNWTCPNCGWKMARNNRHGHCKAGVTIKGKAICPNQPEHPNYKNHLAYLKRKGLQ